MPLFHRHARGLILTEQGEFLHRTAQEIFTKLAMTEAILADSKERPKGPLVVTATVGFSTLWLTPHISEFLNLYPEISITASSASACARPMSLFACARRPSPTSCSAI